MSHSLQLISSVSPAARASMGVLILYWCLLCPIQRPRPAMRAAPYCASCSTEHSVNSRRCARGLDALEQQVSTDVHQIMVAEGGEAVRRLAVGVTEELERLVPGGQVLLEVRPP